MANTGAVPLTCSQNATHTHTHTHTHPFNGPFSRTTRVSRYQKGKTNLDFTEARDSEWQWQNATQHSEYNIMCLQCFDAVGWAAGRASGP